MVFKLHYKQPIAVVVKKLVAAGLLTLVLSSIWNWPLLVSLLKPRVLQTFPSLQSARLPNERGDIFNYPRLGIQAPVNLAPQSSPMLVADWPSLRQSLVRGLDLRFSQSEFYQAAPAFLTGHSSDSYPHTYSSIFAGLGQARPGDKFSLRLAGEEYRYRVVEKRVVDPLQVGKIIEKKNQNNPGSLVLVTCWPPLSTDERLIVFTERN